MYKVEIKDGFFKGYIGVLEGYNFNEAIIKLDVKNSDGSDETLTLLMKSRKYDILKTSAK